MIQESLGQSCHGTQSGSGLEDTGKVQSYLCKYEVKLPQVQVLVFTHSTPKIDGNLFSSKFINMFI